jgi:hypothetical protein
MLKKAVVCVLIAATAAMAWENLDPVPKPLENGEHITYGYGTNEIWGIFPVYADDATYAATYGPLDGANPGWTLLQDPDGFADWMTQTSITFQWQEDGVLFVLGNEDDDPILYFYSLHDNDWDYDDDIPFSVNSGACIAYQPNAICSYLYPVPGWIYCLPGGSTDFWRYSIPSSLPEDPVNGIYPGQGVTIADQTPLFQWGSTMTTSYRLQVSTDPNFSTTVIDVTESGPQHQVTTALANATYHWRFATWTGATWSWSSAHNFILDGGWTQLQWSVPHPVGNGAALAYIDDGQGHDSIIAFLGGGNHYFYEYSIDDPGWTPKASTNWVQNAGTSLATAVPTGHYPWAVFGGEGTSDYPYYFNPFLDPPTWVADVGDGNQFPEPIGSNASATLAPGYMYLAVGNNKHFYRLDPPTLDGGMSALGVRPVNPQAHVVTRYDAVEVEYQLPASGYVRATLHDAVGRQVGVFDAGEQKPGIHRLSWNQDCEGRKLRTR